MDSTAPNERPSLAVQTSGLGKRFGTHAALDGVDLEVPRGSAFGFLGRNGAGRQTGGALNYAQARAALMNGPAPA